MSGKAPDGVKVAREGESPWDPELEGAGPRLVWADEWPDHW